VRASGAKTAKQRLDRVLVERGLAESREKARRLILAGRVRVGGRPAVKAAQPFDPAAPITVEGGPRFVSRGGEKLEAALAAFGLDVRGRLCLDVGASTGGFTDCLLQHGAARVYALDVGRGQLAWRLRRDPRVVVMEGVNARYLQPRDLPEAPDLAAVDVSFISLRRVLPSVTLAVRAGGDVVTLIKPQFEAGRRDVGRGGVVRRPEIRERVVQTLRAFGETECGLAWVGVVESPLRGPAGNVEFLACWRKRQGADPPGGDGTCA
jgi:23S rRNA (cytidine1920-2'-O)/16S rRNA (cytidine1409-2'-O)-methyltransferase